MRLIAFLLLLLPSLALSQTTVFVNELHYDNTGGDTGEGVEIAGPAGTDLAGWSVVLYNGANQQTYNTVNLTGTISNMCSGFGVLHFPIAGIQNGSPDGLALVNDSATVIQFLSYEGAFTAANGPANGMASTDIGVSEPTNSPVGESLQLTGTGTEAEDFVWQAPAAASPGNCNPGQTFLGMAADPVINEFVVDHTGTDTNEYIEVFGSANADYSGFTLIEIEGDSGSTGLIDDGIFTLGTSDANGFFDTGFVNNIIENGTVTLLLVEGFTGAVGNDIDTNDDGVIDATFWTRIVDDVGIPDGGGSDIIYSATALAPNYDGNTFQPGGASRIPDGADTDTTADWIRNDFDGAGIPALDPGTPDPGEALNTPGATNQVISAPPAALVINETDADTPGSDMLEFVELYDGGVGNASLDGFTVVFFNGATDTSYNAFDLDGFTTDANGYLVLGNAGVTGVDIIFGNNGLQNGADAVALYQDNATSFPNGTAVTTTNLVDAVVYDTNDGDDAGLLVLLNPGQPQLNEGNNGAQATESNQRCLNGQGGPRNTSGFVQAVPTPGADNDCSSLLPNVLINEVDADTPGSDMLEFIELYDGGTGNTALDGLVLVFFNGSGDTSYNAIDLDGLSTDAGGYFVAGNAAVSGVDLTFPNNGLQNGADAVALYLGDASSFPNGTAVTTAGLIDAVVYDTNDGDDAGLLALLNAGQPQLNEGENGAQATESNGRCPNGAGGFRNTDAFVQAAPTPGADNTCVLPPLTCGAPATLISAIQGNGAASGMIGSIVEIEGVVVGDFQGLTVNGDLGGFFLQEEDADVDGDPSTSEGIFVFDDILGVDVNPGDIVRVEGTVAEFNGLTELMPVTNVTVCPGTGTATPAMVTLPRTAADDLEPFEGMAVTLPQTLTISSAGNAVRFGEVNLSNGRLFIPTNIVAPGAPAVAQQAANDLNRLILDDARNGSYRMPFINGQDDATPINALNPIRGGTTVSGATGVMSFAFNSYRLRPTAPVVIDESANPRTAAPPAVGGNITVASTNVLNFFDTIDIGGATCGPNNIGCRGADSASELIRQTDKLVAKLIGLDADITGLIEIENNASSSLQALVDAVNVVAGAGTYDFINTNTIGTDAIKVGIIYKPASVTPVGGFAILDSGVDPLFIDNLNRPVLAQTFADGNGSRFTVAVNHLKSKACGGAVGADTDQGDGQACFNLTRTDAATALVNWLAGDPTGSGDSDFLIIGDLNSYAMEDPIVVIENGGYTDLINSFQGADAYSFGFGGQVGYLDHALANASMAAQVTGAAEWHVNADEDGNIDYNEEDLPSGGPPKPADFYSPDAFRAADHDPLIVGLNLTVPEVAFAVASSSVSESGGSINVTVSLNTVSEQDVMVNVDSANGTATAGSDFVAVSETVVIPAGQLSGTVTVNITPDDVDEMNEDLTLTLTSPLNSVLGAQNVHTLTITDDDTAGVNVMPVAGLQTTEAGGTDTFTVVLNSQPTGAVDIGLQSDNPAEGLPSPATLQFTAGNWDQQQTVTVTGQDDAIIDIDVVYNIMVLPATGADPVYIGVDGADVEVTNINDDFANTSFTGPTATGSGDATISFTGGGFQCTFQNVAFVPLDVTAPSAPPIGFVFPHGLVEFTVSGCIPGSTLDFTIEYPSDLFIHTVYWKYAGSPSSPTPRFFEFPAVLNGNTAQFSITDGQLGDADLFVDGVITDPSGPGIRVIETPTLSRWGLILLGLILAGLAVFGSRSRMAAHFR